MAGRNAWAGVDIGRIADIVPDMFRLSFDENSIFWCTVLRGGIRCYLKT